ncbi:hypothetical protein [Lysinibacillus odysseyi]|uniref:Uncharacterized protein n=1 Tax=Lysinibacillus odysseyi 34hs-1 = NBRC 100172 TaxID=1220589 RepID=A0A0A3J1V3_9BACI|nr:hypothetical protein [Lysinibacillus odysseyi]KGR89158.1 hypothetical protein CD32_00630 [Lysinibacillus odysseyi 34hs-1 = NBRC 100172]
MQNQEGSGASMFETVKNHEDRLTGAEKEIEYLNEQVQEIKQQSITLENTILKDSRETREVMRSQTDKLFELVQSALGFQGSRSSQDHELKMLKWNTLSTVFLKISGGLLALLSSGGAVYYLIQYFFTK